MEKGKLENKRIVAQHNGEVGGPLMIVFGAMHGNEKVGVDALTYLDKMLEVEHITNPGFCFKGNLLGIIGNLKAFERGERFIDLDINRHWDKEYIAKIKLKKDEEKLSEDKELLEVNQLIHEAIELFDPPKVYILDLHTTSSDGGIFTIPSNDDESIHIAKGLHAPVITKMMVGLRGTTMHYFNTPNFGKETVALTFEAGQHKDPKSVNRAIAAIINFMRTIACVKSEDVENIHDKILIDYSKNLPKVTTLILRHGIKEDDEFKMIPGFKNFQKVKKGEALANDKNGVIYAPENARLLMPLYQKKGEDGFFLVKDLE